MVVPRLRAVPLAMAKLGSGLLGGGKGEQAEDRRKRRQGKLVGPVDGVLGIQDEKFFFLW